MGLKNGEEYIASVKSHGLEAYVMGEKVGALRPPTCQAKPDGGSSNLCMRP